jgi:hypothetical protein
MITHLSHDEITKSKLPQNKVLVKPDFKQNFIGSGEAKLRIDSRFNEEMHAPTTGVIVNQCTTLDRKSMDWATTIETQIGDEIIFAYETSMACLDEKFKGRLFIDDNMEQYFLFDYEAIFAVKKPDGLIPVNGYILVSAMDEVINSSLNLMAKQSIRYGKVEYLGTPVQFYQRGGRPTNLYTEPKEVVKAGDVIAFSQFSDLPLEYEAHRQTRQILFRMQRCDIDAVV